MVPGPGRSQAVSAHQSPRELMEPAEPTPRFQTPEMEDGQVVLRSG